MSGSASSSDIVQLILINLNLDQPEQLGSFLERIEVLSCCLVGSDNDKQSGLIGNKLGFWIRQLHVGTSTRSPIPQSPTATEGVDGQDPRATSCRLHTDGYPNLSATIVLKKLGIKHTKEWPNLSPTQKAGQGGQLKRRWGSRETPKRARQTSRQLSQCHPLYWHATTRVKHPPGLPNCGSEGSGIVTWCVWLWQWIWWTEMETVILRKIPRGFVPKQNSWLKWCTLLLSTLL